MSSRSLGFPAVKAENVLVRHRGESGAPQAGPGGAVPAAGLLAVAEKESGGVRVLQAGRAGCGRCHCELLFRHTYVCGKSQKKYSTFVRFPKKKKAQW